MDDVAHKPNIAVRTVYGAIQIHLDGALHAHIRRSKFLGVTSWKAGPSNYSIEFSMDGGSILLEYDAEWKFLDVLSGLERELTYAF